MLLDLQALPNPVFALPGVSVRDPAAVWHDGLCYLYYTRQVGGWGGPECWTVAVVTTADFREFSPERLVSPPGYASPGNVIRCGDRWVLVVQSYPWPSEIALLYSDDLLNWSAPRHIIPADTGPGWGAGHGPIDGWLFPYEGRWLCAWVSFLQGTAHRAFGYHASDDLEAWENLTPEAPFVDGSAYNANGGVENCAIVRDGDTWHFFASVGMDPQHLAHTAAGSPWEWAPLTPADQIRLPSAPWCAHSQSALFVADWRDLCGQWAMLYHGQQTPDADATLGLAFSDDLWNWQQAPSPGQ